MVERFSAGIANDQSLQRFDTSEDEKTTHQKHELCGVGAKKKLLGRGDDNILRVDFAVGKNLSDLLAAHKKGRHQCGNGDPAGEFDNRKFRQPRGGKTGINEDIAHNEAEYNDDQYGRIARARNKSTGHQHHRDDHQKCEPVLIQNVGTGYLIRNNIHIELMVEQMVV